MSGYFYSTSDASHAGDFVYIPTADLDSDDENAGWDYTLFYDSEPADDDETNGTVNNIIAGLNIDSDIEEDIANGYAIEANDTQNDILDDETDVSVKTERTDSPSGTLCGEDGTIWSRSPPPTFQVMSHTILREKRSSASSTRMLSARDTFKRIFSDEMCNIVIQETNRKANQLYMEYNNEHPEIEPKTWSTLTAVEFDAYLGVLITAGVRHSNDEHLRDLWTTDAYPLYRAAMGLNRFWEITRLIRFDDHFTRAVRLAVDRAAPISAIWELMNHNLSACYKPSDAITVDEQLYPFKGPATFLQYMPSKPAKCGIKIFWACDARTSYPLHGTIYKGEVDVKREGSVGEEIVKNLVATCNLQDIEALDAA